MKKILIISLSDISFDSRVLRQVLTLRKILNVTVACYGCPKIKKIKIIKIKKCKYSSINKIAQSLLLIFNLFKKFLDLRQEISQVKNLINFNSFSFILVNDPWVLPAALQNAFGAQVFCDLHEDYLNEFNEKIIWRITIGKINKYLIKQYLSHCFEISTVSKILAKQYSAFSKKKIHLIRNLPLYKKIKAKPVDNKKISLIHHGALLQERKIEFLIEIINKLPKNYHLFLMLTGLSSNYGKNLIKLIKKNDKVSLLKPVKPETVPYILNKYDIGLVMYPGKNLNHKYMLPNKFFEYIQGRIAVAIGRNPSMFNVIKRYKNGFIINDNDSSKAANDLTKISANEIFKKKSNSANAAKELNFEKRDQQVLCSLFREN